MSVKQTKENPEALWMGKSFMKMPRKVLALSVSASKKERHLARIYMALATMSYFKPGFMKLGRIQYVCHVGEYFCTYQFLADRTDISIGSVGYYLRKLARDVYKRQKRNAVQISSIQLFCFIVLALY